MSLEDLLTRLESRGATSATATVAADVTRKPAPDKACTPATAATAQNDVTANETTSRRWLLHLDDREPLEVYSSPEATHAEILAMYPRAVAAEPLSDVWDGDSGATRAELERICAWLTHIGETDAATITETLETCRQSSEALAYYLRFAARAASSRQAHFQTGYD